MIALLQPSNFLRRVLLADAAFSLVTIGPPVFEPRTVPLFRVPPKYVVPFG